MKNKEEKKFHELTEVEKQIRFFEWLDYTGMKLIAESIACQLVREHDCGKHDFNYKFVSKLGVEIEFKYKRKLIQT